MTDKSCNAGPPQFATNSLRLPGTGLLAAFVAFPAVAAGGHHAADDAAILDPGQCQVETWADRERGGTRRLLHFGPACRIGPVELGLNLDRTRYAAAEPLDTTGLQIKWATAIGSGLSAGIVAAAAWQQRPSAYLGSTWVVPVTWQASESALVHLNVGRDVRANARDDPRAAAALEWAPFASGSFIFERFRESRVDYWRAGARWTLVPGLNIDLSHAHSQGDSVPGWWTLGLTWAFNH